MNKNLLQTEILSYVVFSFIIFSVISFLLMYFTFLRDRVAKDVNTFNVYSILNLIESPILIFDSVCKYCKVSYNLNINYSIPRNYLFYVSNEGNVRVKYEEMYSSSIIYSNIFNKNVTYFFDILASSDKNIVIEINKFQNKIEVKNKN
ncbi:MAG: hypothetical protein QW197_01545 [Candidatus Aenigmatarchaeota archaeon]